MFLSLTVRMDTLFFLLLCRCVQSSAFVCFLASNLARESNNIFYGWLQYHCGSGARISIGVRHHQTSPAQTPHNSEILSPSTHRITFFASVLLNVNVSRPLRVFGEGDAMREGIFGPAYHRGLKRDLTHKK